MLLGGLLAVAVLMAKVRNPENWAWFTRLSEDRAPEVDTSAPETPPHWTPGTITTPPKQTPHETDHTKPFHERVQRDLLGAVQDDSRFVPKETAAFFHLLRLLKETDEAVIKKSPAERVSYLQLWEQSAEYRGRLVTMRGEVRGVQPKRFPANNDGLEQYYEVWLKHDSKNNATNPIAVYCLELPQGFPAGPSMAEPVEVTGFYYRRWWYQDSENKSRRAPLILTKTLDWAPAPPVVDEPLNLPLLVALIVSAAVVAVTLASWLFFRAARRNQMPPYVRRFLKGQPREDGGGESVQDALRRLEQGEGDDKVTG
jgi:hypothetical protein